MKSESLEEFQGRSLNPPFEVHSPCRVPLEFQWRSILFIFSHKEDLMKSEPLEEKQGSSSEHPHEVRSPCRDPLELQHEEYSSVLVTSSTRGKPK